MASRMGAAMAPAVRCAHAPRVAATAFKAVCVSSVAPPSAWAACSGVVSAAPPAAPWSVVRGICTTAGVASDEMPARSMTLNTISNNEGARKNVRGSGVAWWGWR